MDDVDGAADANDLSFGEEFDTVQCLTNAELVVLLERSKAIKEAGDFTPTTAFNTTLTYAKRYSNLGDRDAQTAATAELRNELEAFQKDGVEGRKELHQYEVAQLCNLMHVDATAEEAVALIPSLSRYAEEDVEEILDIVRKHNS